MSLITWNRKLNMSANISLCPLNVRGLFPNPLYNKGRGALCVCVCVCVLSHVQPMDCSPPSSSVHGIFQARTLEWVAISYSSGYSRRRDRTYISCISWTGRQSLYHCTKWKALRGALVWHRIVSPTFFCPWFTGFPNHCALKHSASVLLNSIGHGVFSWGLGHRINSRIY